MHQDLIQKAADKIWTAYENGQACSPVRDILPVGDVAAAYAVQDMNTTRWLADGRRLVGRKIGLTSKAVQKQLGVDQPDYGMLFADMAFCDGQDIPLTDVLQPKAEAEVALVLDRDLKCERHSIADIISAVAYVLPAIEVVGSRIADWNIRSVDTIADNASSGVFVLGATPYSLRGLDLSLAGMVMERRGEQVSLGCGRACLGHPLNAARWLADVMAEVGRPLLAGDIVLTGALGPMTQITPGDVIDLRINGLGGLRAAFC